MSFGNIWVWKGHHKYPTNYIVHRLYIPHGIYDGWLDKIIYLSDLIVPNNFRLLLH